MKDEKTLTEEKIAADIEKVLRSSSKRKILEGASNTNISKCKYIKNDLPLYINTQLLVLANTTYTMTIYNSYIQ